MTQAETLMEIGKVRRTMRGLERRRSTLWDEEKALTDEGISPTDKNTIRLGEVIKELSDIENALMTLQEKGRQLMRCSK